MQDVSMAGIGMQVLMMVVTTVLGWALGALREKAKAAKENKAELNRERDTARSADRLLLFYRLTDLHQTYVVEGKPCPPTAKESAQEVYDLYHALGGNGAGTQMYTELMQAHVA